MAPANNRGYNNVGPPHSSSSGGPKRPPGASAAVREAWVHPARSTSVDSSRADVTDVEWGGGAVEVGRFEHGGRTPMARYSGGGGGHYRYHMAENGHHQLRARDGGWTHFCELGKSTNLECFKNAAILHVLCFRSAIIQSN